MKLAFAALAISAILLAAPASAVTIAFQDDFSGYGSTTVLNAADSVFGGNWKTTNGTVDYLASGSAFGSLCSTGTNCVDLDGSTNDAGVFETVMTFAPGIYNILFQLSGNNRFGVDQFAILFGGTTFFSDLIQFDQVRSQADYGTDYLNLAVTAPTTLAIVNAGGDNIGLLLKSVVVEKVAAIPVPAAGWLLALGLGALGLMRRNKRATA